MFGITGRKARRRSFKSFVKARGSTPELHRILEDLRQVEASGIPGVAVECVDIRKNTCGEGG